MSLQELILSNGVVILDQHRSDSIGAKLFTFGRVSFPLKRVTLSIFMFAHFDLLEADEVAQMFSEAMKSSTAWSPLASVSTPTVADFPSFRGILISP